jgi:hypothetical protein
MGIPAMTFLADHPINHPISNHYTRIPVVCSFVAEAEYGGLFAAARIAVDERKILVELGHPQPVTVIFRDNEVAIGLANRTVCPNMSKSLDMRFHCLRDHIDRGQLRVLFVSCKKNLADFFTKVLPVARHNVVAPFFAVGDDSPDSIDLRLSTILFSASLFTQRNKRVMLITR